jgi:hypothetical protein
MGLSKDVTELELAGLSSASNASALPYAVPIGDPFQRLFGMGRTLQGQLIAHGEIESVLVGGPSRGRRLIIVASVIAYYKRQKQREAAGEIGMASPNPRARQRPAIAVAAPARTVQRPQANAQPRQQFRSRRSN